MIRILKVLVRKKSPQLTGVNQGDESSNSKRLEYATGFTKSKTKIGGKK